MEPVTIALICATVFGAVVAISAFVRQLLLSRDKKLNDSAQRQALQKEANHLTALRKQLESTERFDIHYRMLDRNVDAIRYIDQQIEEIIEKKLALNARYSDVVFKQSSAIIDGKFTQENHQDCRLLKLEIDKELARYDEEILTLQKRRAKLWDSHQELQQQLLDQEKQRNTKLDEIYQQHTGVLEKLALRHSQDSVSVATKTLEEGTNTFKMILLAPIKFLLAFFTKTDNIDIGTVNSEIDSREEVKNAQDEIGGYEDEYDYEYDEDEEEALTITS